ncbi:MAG: hypothetical protein ABIC95_02030 [archaeon]
MAVKKKAKKPVKSAAKEAAPRIIKAEIKQVAGAAKKKAFIAAKAAKAKAHKALEIAKKKYALHEAKVKKMIQKDPKKAVALAVAVGAALGAGVALALRKKKK